MEVVHIYGPGHGTSVSPLLDKVHLDLYGCLVLVAHPLCVLVGVGHHASVIPLYRPSLGLVHHLGANFVVGQKAAGIRVGTRSSAACLLIDVGAHIVVLVRIAQRERPTVEGDTHHQLVGRAAHLLPQRKAVVLEWRR